MQTLIIGTRGSALALIQAKIIESKLKEVDSSLTIETKIIKTEGDKNQSPIPSSSVGKAWFTKEIEKELLGETIDIAVHSLKDLPNLLPESLCISAYCQREDARDVSVSKSGKRLAALPEGAVVGTDSLRRKAQILYKYPHLKVASIRGNVPTRLSKLDSGTEYDALILAGAGLLRLDLEDRITESFEFNEIIPAPGQGVLAVETRISGYASEIVKQINHFETEKCATAERSFSIHVGGGCKTPVGAYAASVEGKITLIGMIALPDGHELIIDQITGLQNDADNLGKQLAQRMLSQCSPECLALLKGEE